MGRGSSDAVKMYFRNARKVFQAIPGIEWVKANRYRNARGYVYVDMRHYDVEIKEGHLFSYAMIIPKEEVE